MNHNLDEVSSLSLLTSWTLDLLHFTLNNMMSGSACHQMQLVELLWVFPNKKKKDLTTAMNDLVIFRLLQCASNVTEWCSG